MNKAIGKHLLVSSTLLVIEVYRCFIRLTRDHQISNNEFALLIGQLKSDIEDINFQPLDLTLSMDPAFPVVSLPKAADLVHLKTALYFQHKFSDVLFLSCDVQQCKAAEEMGLVTIEF